MATDAQVRKGPVAEPEGAEQLPQGEAKELNDALAAIPEVGAQSETPQFEPVTRGGREAPFRPETEEEQFLFGPTTRPEEPLGTGMRGARIEPPADMGSWLPALVEASQRPGAPRQLRTLVALILHHMET